MGWFVVTGPSYTFQQWHVCTFITSRACAYYMTPAIVHTQTQTCVLCECKNNAVSHLVFISFEYVLCYTFHQYSKHLVGECTLFHLIVLPQPFPVAQWSKLTSHLMPLSTGRKLTTQKWQGSLVHAMPSLNWPMMHLQQGLVELLVNGLKLM